jgi:hypothetical protein
MGKADRDVYIVKVGDEYRVRPAIAPVKGNAKGKGGQPGKVVFRNTTDDSVTVLFPTGIVTLPDSKTMARRGEAEFTLEDVTEVTAVTYMVVVSKDGELVMANGESGPKIIIDP